MMESAANALGFSSVTSFIWFVAILFAVGYVVAPQVTRSVGQWVVDKIRSIVTEIQANTRPTESPEKSVAVEGEVSGRIAELDSIPGISDEAFREYAKSGKTLNQAMREELTKRSPAAPKA